MKVLSVILLVLAAGCAAPVREESMKLDNAKPYTRWWWFSEEIREQEIRDQLEWLAENGFGGVEIAWIYAPPDAKAGPAWLSGEWTRLVAFTKQCASGLGLGCDFTFGSLWPFGGSIVTEKDAAKTFDGLSEQRLNKCWEGDGHFVLDHLDRGALERYAERMGAALRPALEGPPSALFCDSWEVRTEKLWTDGFADVFRERNGYDIEAYMEELDRHPHARYDYRKLISDYTIREFYEPFTEIAHGMNAYTRVQCHGAPADLVAAYCAVDLPETESILFDPHFAGLAKSAAAIRGHGLVSCETFTCLYGWERYPGPGPYQGRERIADLRLLADAVFANGVNFIVWHGMPFGGNRFYASVHVGPDSAFAGELKAFNRYMETVSALLRKGRVYTDVAVYLPLEDLWMQNELPEAMRRPSAHYHWELQYQRLPLPGYHPLWVTERILEDARVEDGKLVCGDAVFSVLYIDVEWLDAAALAAITRLAEQGLPVCINRRPSKPGLKEAAYEPDRLMSMSVDLGDLVPLVEGKDPPEFTCRLLEDGAIFFFAHPASKRLAYPMAYGQADEAKAVEWSGKINLFGRTEEVRLRFKANQSIALEVKRDGGIRYLDL